MLRTVIKMTSLIIGIVLFAIVFCGVLFFYLSPEFGHKPDSAQKVVYESLPNYSNGKFINSIPTEMKMDFPTVLSLIKDHLKGNVNGRPQTPLPVDPINPVRLNNADSPSIVWFGHSAFFLKIEGLNILIDPMLGNAPAPHPLLGGKRFNTTLPIKPEALPAIDLVIFSHDHYDHLDYGSVIQLKDKVSRFYVPLGVGAHLRFWGVAESKIYELNWGDSISYKNISFTCAPARHFSGRSLLDRNSTLWCSWVIKSPQKKLFFSGDSGYGPHFKEIGAKYGPFDFAMMECGQYDKRWENIHMLPEQTIQAAQDIRAKLIMPIHWGAFKLALHDWKDPIVRASRTAKDTGISIITPRIGEIVTLNGQPVITENWWENY